MQDAQTLEYEPGGSSWGYDTLGNWATLTDSTIAYDPQIPDPFDDPSAEVEARDHNNANELAAADNCSLKCDTGTQQYNQEVEI